MLISQRNNLLFLHYNKLNDFFEAVEILAFFIACSFCFYFIQPNFNSKNSDFKINFGLDIQGGYSYLLELNENEFKQNLLVKMIQVLENSYSLQSEIFEDQILVPSGQNIENLNNIVVQSLGLEVVDRSNDGIYLGILEQSFNQSLSEMTLNAVEIVRSRVDFLGNKELSIQKVGLNKILLEIPGDLDNNVKDVISKTAKLTLHIEKEHWLIQNCFLMRKQEKMFEFKKFQI